MQAHSNQAKDDQRMDASTIQVSANRKAESKTAIDVHRESMQHSPKLKLVIAGSHREYVDWLRESGVLPQNTRYIDTPHKLRGMRFCEVVLTGRYWLNPAHEDPYLACVVMEQ